MKTRTVVCTALLALATALSACSSAGPPGPDRAACKAARTEQVRKEYAEGRSAPGRPPAECDGVDARTMQRYTSEIVQKKLPPTRLPDITPECRSWIKEELLDNSADIDGASGKGPCGYMSGLELDRAVLRVSKDMISQDATPSP